MASIPSVPRTCSPSLSHNILFVPIESSPRTIFSLLHRIFKTQMNKFGLFHVYNTGSLPLHNPEDPYSVEHSCSPCVNSESSHMEPSNEPCDNQYHPYSNETSMCLGDWYWNQGAQKSKESFKQLLGIISHPVFSPSAVSQTPWDAIDEQLGKNRFDDDLEWLNQDDGWKCSAVTISVPFHSQCSNPGAKYYTVDGFYHCSLVSIVKEKLVNPAHTSRFHFEPYELRWQPSHKDHDIKVHGKLFTSTTFFKMNKALQASPPEPDCDLPRVVAVLMFWSDAI
jgi:hypothetical protein